jgi:hypothetical protein
MKLCPFSIVDVCAGSLSLMVACSDPLGLDTTRTQAPDAPEICPASEDWLPATAPLPMFNPLPHPATECPFYRGGWQNFLVAMQPDEQGQPALLRYPTIDSVFVPTIPRSGTRSMLGLVKQAGGRQILIDQNDNTLYYGIHVNQAFADFIKANGLDTANGLKAYPTDPVKRNLTFPPGVVEFKSAWQLVEGDAAAVAAQTAEFISITTTVPTLAQDPNTKRISEDRDRPISVTLRLLAIHVVFTLPGHPEFIWASFEHSDGTPDARSSDGHRDVAPTFPEVNPSPDDPLNQANAAVVSAVDHILYKHGTPANQANRPVGDTSLMLVGQKFPGQQTSVYRMFPASKSNTVDPDDAVTSLNHNVEALFAEHAGSLSAKDKRGHYRLAGAQWMDKPQFFTVDSSFQNDASSPFLKPHAERRGNTVTNVAAVPVAELTTDIVENGSDSPLSILGGEDRLSSTAMESFTQGPVSFNNCFTCHNTQAITANGIPLNRDSSGTPLKLLSPGLLNVSHVLTEFLLEDQEATGAAP